MQARLGMERLDIVNQFLTPGGIAPRQHRVIETTDILLQIVASGRIFRRMFDGSGECLSMNTLISAGSRDKPSC